MIFSIEVVDRVQKTIDDFIVSEEHMKMYKLFGRIIIWQSIFVYESDVVSIDEEDAPTVGFKQGANDK